MQLGRWPVLILSQWAINLARQTQAFPKEWPQTETQSTRCARMFNLRRRGITNQKSNLLNFSKSRHLVGEKCSLSGVFAFLQLPFVLGPKRKKIAASCLPSARREKTVDICSWGPGRWRRHKSPSVHLSKASGAESCVIAFRVVLWLPSSSESKHLVELAHSFWSEACWCS